MRQDNGGPRPTPQPFPAIAETAAASEATGGSESSPLASSIDISKSPSWWRKIPDIYKALGVCVAIFIGGSTVATRYATRENLDNHAAKEVSARAALEDKDEEQRKQQVQFAIDVTAVNVKLGALDEKISRVDKGVTRLTDRLLDSPLPPRKR